MTERAIKMFIPGINISPLYVRQATADSGHLVGRTKPSPQRGFSNELHCAQYSAAVPATCQKINTCIKM